MVSTNLRVLTALVALTAAAAWGSDDNARQRRDGDRRAAGSDAERGRFVAIPNAAAPGEPGHGWQYFADAQGRRAVVISPGGTYYLSRGKGLRRVIDTGVDRRG